MGTNPFRCLRNRHSRAGGLNASQRGLCQAFLLTATRRFKSIGGARKKWNPKNSWGEIWRKVRAVYLGTLIFRAEGPQMSTMPGKPVRSEPFLLRLKHTAPKRVYRRLTMITARVLDLPNANLAKDAGAQNDGILQKVWRLQAAQTCSSRHMKLAGSGLGEGRCVSWVGARCV